MLKPTLEQHEAVWKLQQLPARQVIAPCGFGKTLIGVEIDFRIPFHQGPRLVITTSGGLTQWRNTFQEQGGQGASVRGARVHVFHQENRDEFLAALTEPKNDIFVLPWHMLNKPQKTTTPARKLWARDVLFPVLAKVKWAHIIADEAHKLNGRKTAMTLAVKALKTKYKTPVTATPAANVPWQWWSILNWLYPKGVPQEVYEHCVETKDQAKELAELSQRMFSSYWRFFDRYVIYEEIRKGHVVIKEPVTVRRAEEFSKLIEPFTYRGKKVEYAGKRYQTIEVDLAPKQRRAYDTMKKHFVAWLGEQEDEFLPVPNVVSQLQRLQQFALGYATIETKQVYQKKPEQIFPDTERKDHKLVDVHQVVLSEPSAKLDAFMEFLEDNPNERALVYSSFRGPLDLLQERLKKAGVSFGVYMGGDQANAVQRERAKSDFAAGRLRIMLASVQAGGESIDGWQHACNTVVYLDRPWSPATNEQSEGRLDRRGQKYTVNVIDIVARDTVDIPRGVKLETKKAWLRAFVGNK